MIAELGGYQDPEPQLVTRRYQDEGWVEFEHTRGAREAVLHEAQVGVVCRECNSGWMSNFEKTVKPIIIRLVSERGFDVSAEDQRTLASWAHKTFLMYDQWRPVEDRRYHPEDYHAFYRDRLPPENSRLYLGYSPFATFGMYSDSRCLIPAGVDEQAYMDAYSPNCGSSFIAADGLFLVEHWFSPHYPTHVRLRMFGRSPMAASHRTLQKLRVHAIWPQPQQFSNWRRQELGEGGLEAARLSLYNTMLNARVHAKRRESAP